MGCPTCRGFGQIIDEYGCKVTCEVCAGTGALPSPRRDLHDLCERVAVTWTWDGARWSREDDRHDETPADREADWMRTLEERGRHAD